MSALTQLRMKRARKAAFYAQDGLCYWCKEPMIWKTQANAKEVWDHPRVCTGDHLQFACHGGKITSDNIVAACRECNNSRQPIHIEWKWLGNLIWPLVHEHGFGPRR